MQGKNAVMCFAVLVGIATQAGSTHFSPETVESSRIRSDIRRIANEVARVQAYPGRGVAPDIAALALNTANRIPPSERESELRDEAKMLVARLQSDIPHEEIETILTRVTAIEGLLRQEESKSALDMSFLSAMAMAPSPNVAPNYNQLEVGDLIFIRDGDSSKNWSWADQYGHVGVFAGGTPPKVYESNFHDGVNHHLLDDWKKRKGAVIAFGRCRAAEVRPQIPLALSRALTTFRSGGHTPYNFFFWDKHTNRRLYCSQLVWKMYDHIGFDVDSNDPLYHAVIARRWSNWMVRNVVRPAVAPDEVARSPHVEVYFRGRIP